MCFRPLEFNRGAVFVYVMHTDCPHLHLCGVVWSRLRPSQGIYTSNFVARSRCVNTPRQKVHSRKIFVLFHICAVFFSDLTRNLFYFKEFWKINLLFPAEGWKVYKRGCLSVCLSVCHKKTMKALRFFKTLVSGRDIFIFF